MCRKRSHKPEAPVSLLIEISRQRYECERGSEIPSTFCQIIRKLNVTLETHCTQIYITNSRAFGSDHKHQITILIQMAPDNTETSTLLPGSRVDRFPSPPHTNSGRISYSLLAIFRTLNFVTGLTAVSVGVAFFLAIIVRGSAPSEQKDIYFYSGQGIRVFGVVLAATLLLVETEASFILKWTPLLDLWMGRGVVQLFLACLTYREAYPRGDTDMHKSLQLYRTASSAALIGCAAVHILGSALCLGQLRRALLKKERDLMNAEQELIEIERRRRELSRALGRNVEV